MIRKVLILLMFLLFAAQAVFLFFYAFLPSDLSQDVIAVNELIHALEENRDSPEKLQISANLDYVVLDAEGSVLFRTGEGLSESISQAVRHRDTILTVEGGSGAHNVIIFNNTSRQLQARRLRTSLLFFLLLLLQWSVLAGLFLYLNHTIVRPFRKLKAFARRIAEGNLDIPLEMDRHNLFGAFTESFDLMRSELKRARMAEAKASISKKELVAKLSHDIRTPAASIKAAAEVGAALTDNASLRNHFTQIIRKADQISVLVNDLFTAALEELQQLPVTPGELESRELQLLLENADYLGKAAVPPIPDCLLYGDRLRLQQVFDNLFANSYKYAGSDIELSVSADDGFISVVIEDEGGGVSPEELPLLKEKYRRGSNAEHMEGAGLGLYISDYFMKKMQGALLVENGRTGLRVTVMIQKIHCVCPSPNYI